MRPAHHASPRARRQRRPPAKYEAVPASATLSGDFAVAPAPATTETRSNETVKLSTNPALWVKGAVVAVHCPEDEPCPFWLSRIDADTDGADETMITWLEPTGKGGKSYAIGGEDPIATTSIICTVREAGRWKSGRAFTLTPAEREAVLELIEAEHCVDVEDTDEEAEEAQQARLPPSVPMVHLDGLPGSGKTYICSQLAKTHGYSVIELDEITQRPGENFGFKQRIRSLDQLRRAFHREITARVAKTQRDADSPVLLSGVSRVLAEQWGELCIIPPELQTAKIWIDIAPPSGVSYTGKLLKSVMRLRKMGVADSHIAEVVESARRAVLRDLRDTAPTAWAATAEDWGDDSSFYTHMADNHPDAQLSAADFETLCFAMDIEATYKSKQVPQLAEWTALTVDDMTGRGAEGDEGEQYHTARIKAEIDGYTATHWTKIVDAVVAHCATPESAAPMSPCMDTVSIPQTPRTARRNAPPASPLEAPEAEKTQTEDDTRVEDLNKAMAEVAVQPRKKKTVFACPTPSPSTVPPTKKKKKRTPFKPRFEGTAPAVEDGGFCLFMDKTGRTYSNGETQRAKREEQAAKNATRAEAEVKAAAAAAAEKMAAEPAAAEASAIAEHAEGATGEHTATEQDAVENVPMSEQQMVAEEAAENATCEQPAGEQVAETDDTNEHAEAEAEILAAVATDAAEKKAETETTVGTQADAVGQIADPDTGSLDASDGTCAGGDDSLVATASEMETDDEEDSETDIDETDVSSIESDEAASPTASPQQSMSSEALGGKIRELERALASAVETSIAVLTPARNAVAHVSSPTNSEEHSDAESTMDSSSGSPGRLGGMLGGALAKYTAGRARGDILGDMSNASPAHFTGRTPARDSARKMREQQEQHQSEHSVHDKMRTMDLSTGSVDNSDSDSDSGSSDSEMEAEQSVGTSGSRSRTKCAAAEIDEDGICDQMAGLCTVNEP